MLEHVRSGGSPFWDLAWQSSAFLLLGGLACLAFSRRPSRAHRALALATIAALITPALGQVARARGWGLLSAGAVVASPIETPPPTAVRTISSHRPEMPAIGPESHELAASPVPSGAVVDGPVAPRPRPIRAAIPWSTAAWLAWLAASVVLLARLVVAFVAGRRLTARAWPIDGGEIARAAEAARRTLGVGVSPRALASDRVASPVIWCWGRRPALLVPTSAVEAGDPAGRVDWTAVMTHELAHWLRRDHLVDLLAEVATCLLPWNPLAWWARKRLGELSELACDDWVIASGGSPADYAESLLGLVPQGRRALALAAVSRRGSLVERVGRILEDRRRLPAAGLAWTAIAALATALAAGITALAQPQRPDPSKERADVVAGKPKDVEGEGRDPKDVPASVHLTVLGVDGTPKAGAEVTWLAMRVPDSYGMPLPVAEQDENSARAAILARGLTDAAGRFESKASLSPKKYVGSLLIVRAEGAGITGRSSYTQMPGGPPEFAGPVTVRLRPSKTIEGRLLAPSGMPAAGVRVTLVGYGNQAESEIESEGIMGWPLRDHPEDLLDFWPGPFATDQDGRFRVEGIVPEGMMANLQLRHPDFADSDLSISTGLEITTTNRAESRDEPLPAKFTYTLEPARPVEGVVTDKETGKPLAGVAVKMIPFRQGSGDWVVGKTDERGHYRLAGKLGDSYWATAYPDPVSGYIPLEKRHEGWPAGASSLMMDFALAKGRVLRGRVVEDGTGRPIRAASVAYRPDQGNPHNRGSFEFRNPTSTDADGRFVLTGLAGPGTIAVDGPGVSSNYVRVPIVDPKAKELRHAFPHGFARLDVPTEGEAPESRISLRNGVVLEADVVDPDGKPLDEVIGWCAELMARQFDNWESPQPFVGGRFRLQGAEPGRTYRVFLVHPKRKLGALAELTYAPGKPTEVRLRPAATAKGVVTDKNGKPLEGAQILPYIVLTSDPSPIKDDDFFDRGRSTVFTMFTREPLLQVYPSEFRYDTLIPGVRYYVGVYRDGWTHHELPVFGPGEVRDVGPIAHKVEDRP